jgi:hypothetical protein
MTFFDMHVMGSQHLIKKMVSGYYKPDNAKE